MNRIPFSAATYQERREVLTSAVGSGIIVLLGLNEAPMNYTANIYRFRQDSNFLYYCGVSLPGMAATIDCNSGVATIYGDDYTIDDIIWMGDQPSLSNHGAAVGIQLVKSAAALAEDINKAVRQGETIHYLPPYRHDNIIKLHQILNIPLSQVSTRVSEPLIKAVVNQRSIKSKDEIRLMTHAVNASRAMHLRAMQIAKPGASEASIVGEILNAAHQHGCEHLSYNPIVSVNGQVLHNHDHHNTLKAGQLLLNDSGAEEPFGYAGDITRTIPVDGKFTSKQAEIYQIVQDMEELGIQLSMPGKSYKEVHLDTNRLMLQSLSDLNIVNGDIDDMLTEGVGGLFMPHGLGHMIGLDVHDMEDLGEQYVGYVPGLERSTQMGLKSLRLAKNLEEGYVITVEPGIYFIPHLIEKWKSEGKFKDFVNYGLLETYYDFGGIRIEDDVWVTTAGPVVLGDEVIPKTISAIEEIMGH